MKIIFLSLIVLFYGSIKAQVGINTISPKASLDIEVSNRVLPDETDGILIPRVDEFSVTTPISAQDGMLVFVTGNGTPAKGFYYWDDNSSSWVPINKTRHYVGELYGGGIVYYVYDDGEHGLIASLDDLDDGSGVTWGLDGVDVTNCESYFDGITNTASIIAAGGQSNEAAGLCNTYTAFGFSDWYLPSLLELREMENAILTLNIVLTNDGDATSNPISMDYFSLHSYWTSTEYIGSSTSYSHNFYSFFTQMHSKTSTHKVRAIRSF
ncbi:MAG: DUF1566 domain-containing protein [Altibacter sp.]|uniref:hypothetical protein n=1 Tax=Altibacter sp. TaxID=2024823 RepID=UPI001DCCED60|nr:hypothetical protein [Altibacter sp.]MBZ0327561.1 DUF1566 domain-containing protein [Altibacter sp.]